MCKNRIIIAICALLTISGCQVADSYFRLANNSISVSSDGGEFVIGIETNMAYNPVSPYSWIEPSVSDGEGLVISILPNNSEESRQGEVSLFYGDNIDKFIVYQEPKPTLNLSAERIYTSNSGESIRLFVSSNIEYEINVDVNWIKASDTKSMTDSAHRFEIEPNDNTDERTGHIIFSNITKGVTKQYTVVQQALELLAVSDNEFDLPNTGGSLQVSLTTNLQVKVEVGCPWIQYAETKAVTTSELYFNIEKNPDFVPRTGYIRIFDEVSGKAERLEIRQEATLFLTASISQIRLDSNSGTFSFEVDSNCEYSVVCDTDWLSDSAMNNSQEKRHVFSYEKNNSFQSREAVIQLRSQHEDTFFEISVVQNGRQPVLLFHQSGDKFQLPVLEGDVFSYTVDWGDGSSENYRPSLIHYYNDSKSEHIVAIHVSALNAISFQNLMNLDEINLSEINMLSGVK